MLMEEESCPIYDTDNEEDAKPAPKYDFDGDELVYEDEEAYLPDVGESLVIQRALNVDASKTDNDLWLRNNNFRTKCTSKGKVCNMIIDGGSCKNVVITHMVQKLGLNEEGHPEPYQFTWLKKGNVINGYHGGHYETHGNMEPYRRTQDSKLSSQDYIRNHDNLKGPYRRTRLSQLVTQAYIKFPSECLQKITKGGGDIGLLKTLLTMYLPMVEVLLVVTCIVLNMGDDVSQALLVYGGVVVKHVARKLKDNITQARMFDSPESYNGKKNGYQEPLQSRTTMMTTESIGLCWSNFLCSGVSVSRVTTSKYRLKFMLDRKELFLTLDDFRSIFHLPQATDNNHDSFVPPPSFYDMISFYKNYLEFTMELKTPYSFKTIGLLQSRQTLCKIFSKCLTTREGIHYSLLHSTSSIPYPRFMKIIIGHYMTNFLEISRRARDKYHNLKDDDLMKNIFNSRRYKEKVGMKILDWIITKAMKQTEHYRMYAERSTRHIAPALVLTVNKADELILQDTLQVSLAEHKSRQEQKARENVALVDEQLASMEIEKMVEGQENIDDDSSIHRNDEHNIPDTRLEPRSDKESPDVRITNVIVPVNVYDEKEKEEEIIDEARFMPQNSFGTLANHLHDAMAESLPVMVDKHVKEQVEQQVPEQLYLSMKDDPQWKQQDIAIWLALQMKFERLQVPQTTCRTLVVRPRDQDNPHDDAHLEGENNAKRQNTLEYGAYASEESSSRQDNEQEQDDDEIPTKQVSQDIMKEVSLTIDEAKLKKITDEMLRQRCTSGDEHQYHIDQMKNFLKSDIVWESQKEIFISQHPRKTTPLVLSCQRDPKAPALSLINRDLLYLKKGNSWPEKIVLSLHKFPVVVFNDDDIEEGTSTWVNKCVKKFNPYARYGVEHWKNPHAKIFYTRKQKEPRKLKEPDFKNLNKNDFEDMYLLIMNGKVPDYAETGLLWSLSVFIKISVIWERVRDFLLRIKSYQPKVNLNTPTISFPEIEKHEMFFIIYEPVQGFIYKNSKKEKRVIKHSKIHKFYDATLNRVLKGLKSYNNDVRYGYNQRDLTKDEVKYLKLFKEEIEDRWKYKRQIRRISKACFGGCRWKDLDA
nr:putative reverse transcriptase domain-containing protein [Tanacetum cinerariifolium]